MLLLITCWITVHHPNLFHKSTLLTEMKVENIFAHSWLPCVALMRLLRHKTDFELSDSLWCSVLAHVDLLPFTSPTSQPHQSQWQQKQQGKKTEACTETAKKKCASKSNSCLLCKKKKKARKVVGYHFKENKQKHADAGATLRRMHSAVALFFITGEGPLMVFYTTLLFQALHTISILLSAAVTLSIIHNMDFAMLSMQLAQTQPLAFVV